MNGVIVTTAIRQDEATTCIKKLIQYTPPPYKIILMHNPGKLELDMAWPIKLANQYNLIYHKMPVGQPGGLTAAWNYGFKYLYQEGCSAIICTNDDVYVNETWFNIFDTIKKYPLTIVGPVSARPGEDYTGLQKQNSPTNTQWHITKEFPANTNNTLYCLNGFCFGLNAHLINSLIQKYGDVLNEINYPWGGNEEDLGRRIQKIGATLIVDGFTYVDHLKFKDWRTYHLDKQ